MTKLNYTFLVNKSKWGKEQLERLEYERNLHILHSMKQHGIEIKDGDQNLSDDDIDYLTTDKAWEVSINNRLQYTGDKIINIYQSSLKKSDAFWKNLAFNPEHPMKVSRATMAVSGVSLKSFMQMMHSMQTDDKVGLAAHPEHFICSVQWDNGELIGIEPFGMYGTPTLVNVTVVKDSDLNASILADKDPSFPISMAGKTFLSDGKTAVNIPFHQFKPTSDGFEAKMAVYWPENTPQEIVDGHALHLAMEFFGGLKLLDK
ncbi:hypothetical protein Nizo2535_0970 [Lactiplantibacillus plantarum]|uniref:hypothetical protein n=1 Tax=Lactiplantibacillus plantarum TaxID=1590 RepID=UPI0007B559E6|nr:hypothetical protein [Lactiplantibacillus plantarum]KZU34492.1 hypothetical protein Nizo2535_0970 [Lactiplantibacillus plantarum]KZU75086.1 hypothetical protein Nizo2891_2837 [Lactiplantibacillus plantarum]